MEEMTGGEKYETGPASDYNRIKKWGDRNFEDPKYENCILSIISHL